MITTMKISMSSETESLHRNMNTSAETSNSSGADEFVGNPVNWEFSVVVVAFGSVMLASGLLGNGLLLLVMWRRRGLSEFHNSFIANLALADLVVTCSGLPGFLVDLVRGRHPVANQLHCRLNAAVLCTSYSVSILSLILISLNRYFKVCHRAAFRRLFSARRNRIICVSLWPLSLLLNALAFVPSDTPYGYDPGSRICNPRAGRTGRPEITSVIMVAMLVVPVLLIGYFNAAIFRHWRGSRLRLQRIRAAGVATKKRRVAGNRDGAQGSRGWRGAKKPSWKAFVARSMLDLTAEGGPGASFSEADRSGVELKGYSFSEPTSVVQTASSACEDASVSEERESTSPEKGKEEEKQQQQQQQDVRKEGSESPGQPHPPSPPPPPSTTSTTPHGDALFEQKAEENVTVTTIATTTTTIRKAEVIASTNGGFSVVVVVGDDPEPGFVYRKAGGDDAVTNDRTEAALPPPPLPQRISLATKTTTEAAREGLSASVNYLDKIADAIAVIERNSGYQDPPPAPPPLLPPRPAAPAGLAPDYDDENVKERKKKRSVRRKAGGDRPSRRLRPISSQLPRTGNNDDATAAAAKTAPKRLASTFRIQRRHHKQQHPALLDAAGKHAKHHNHKEGGGGKGSARSENFPRPSLKSLLMDAEFLWWSDIHVADADPDPDPDPDSVSNLYRDCGVRELADQTVMTLDDSFSAGDVIARFVEESETVTLRGGGAGGGCFSAAADGSLPSTLTRDGDAIDNDDNGGGNDDNDDDVEAALSRSSARASVWHPSIDRVGARCRMYRKAGERKGGRGRGGGGGRQMNWRHALSLARRKTASDMALVRSLLVISVILFLLYTPFAVYLFLTFFPGRPAPPEVPVLFTLLLFVNCAVNWIVYGIMNTAFRRAYVRTLKNVTLCCVRCVTGAGNATTTATTAASLQSPPPLLSPTSRQEDGGFSPVSERSNPFDARDES